jgi:hypothetical protein
VIEAKRFTDHDAVTIDDCGLVFLFGGANSDDEFSFDPLTLLVKLFLIHEILLSFLYNKRIGEDI